MNRATWLAATALPLFIFVGGAQAQPAAGGQSAQLDELVVTAQKRSENLQDVPIAVAAVTGEVIKDSGLQSTLDIPNLVPGLVITRSGNSALPYLRGVGQSSATSGIESNVGLYIDGVYLSEQASGVFDLNNIEQVEVLKGPQGTLFGRNTTGGVIHIITRQPSPTPKLEADVGYGNYQTYSGHLYATGPLSDTLSASLAMGGMKRAKGFGHNVFTNDEIFKAESFNTQIKLLWTPTDSTRVTLSGMQNYGWSQILANGVYPGALAQDRRTRYISRYDISAAFRPEAKVRHHLASLRIEQDLGWAEIVNIAAVREFDENVIVTANGIPNGSGAANNATLPAHSHSFSNEFQIQSPAESKIQWIAGAFYLFNHVNRQTLLYADNTFSQNVIGKQDTKSYSVFAQATAPLTDRTRLTGGIRYTVDRKSVEGVRYNATGGVITTFAASLAGINQPTEKTWKQPTWRLALDHDLTDDSMLYASYNRGFKSGIYNLSSFTNPPANPEKLDAYEIGLKNTLFDNRVRLNLAAFYYDYQDIQLRAQVPPVVTGFVTNAARSHVKGLDVDFEVRAAPGLTITGGAAFLDAKYKSYPGATCATPVPTGGNGAAVRCDVTGNHLIRAPKLTANLGVRYVHELDSGASITLTANDFYNDGFYWEPSNRLHQKAYHNLSGSVRYEPPGGRWAISAWGKNLTDSTYFLQGAESATDIYAPGEPALYGVTLYLTLGS